MGMASWIIHLRIAENLPGLFPGLDFLSPEGVRRNVARIQQYYQRTDAQIQALYNRPYIYIFGAEVDRFVDESIPQLSRIF